MNQGDQVLAIVERQGFVRSSDLTAAGLPRALLMRLVHAGRLKQVARGHYTLPAQPVSREHELAEVASRSRRGVFCLLTALHFHRLLPRRPDAVWLAIPNKARAPTGGDIALEVLRFSGHALIEGVEHYVVDGIDIRVYGAAKTVIDCFRFRERIGEDVALDALRRYRRLPAASETELWRCARLCRVREAMAPHLDPAADRTTRPRTTKAQDDEDRE